MIDGIVHGGAFPREGIVVRLSPSGVFGVIRSEDNNVFSPRLTKQLRPEYNDSLAYLRLMDGLGFGFHGKARMSRSCK